MHLTESRSEYGPRGLSRARAAAAPAPAALRMNLKDETAPRPPP
jgi:hypothetical protein